jgi:hypothetical protein
LVKIGPVELYSRALKQRMGASWGTQQDALLSSAHEKTRHAGASGSHLWSMPIPLAKMFRKVKQILSLGENSLG